MNYLIDDKEWKPTRPNLTSKVFGKSLIPHEWTDVIMVITKVEPGGEFPSHTDKYHHIFFYLKGTGIGWIEDKEYEIKPNLVVEIPAGKKHGYKNTSENELVLITMNIPIK